MVRKMKESDRIMNGGMGEWLKPAVLKTVELERVPGVRIPLPPPFFFSNLFLILGAFSGAGIRSCVGVECSQIVQPEESHEFPPPRAVLEPLAPVRRIPNVGVRPTAAGSRGRRRPLEV